MCGQFSRVQTEQIRQAVLDCSIRRLTVYETQLFIKEHLHIDISYPTINRYKYRQKQDAHKWISRMAKSKNADYVAEYIARIDEIYKVQGELWKMIKDDSGRVHSRTKVEACRTLIQCSNHLVELFDAMPLIKAVKDYTDGTGTGVEIGIGESSPSFEFDSKNL